jgi:hypothetical protein
MIFHYAVNITYLLPWAIIGVQSSVCVSDTYSFLPHPTAHTVRDILKAQGYVSHSLTNYNHKIVGGDQLYYSQLNKS